MNPYRHQTFRQYPFKVSRLFGDQDPYFVELQVTDKIWIGVELTNDEARILGESLLGKRPVT